MEIKKEITVKLSPKDLKEIIRKHLKETQNLDVSYIYFDVNGHNSEDDFFAERSLDYRLDEVVCKATEA